MMSNRLGSVAIVQPEMGSLTRVFNAVLRFAAAFVTLALLMLAPVRAAETSAATPAPEAIAARVTTTPERARLIIDLSAPTQFAVVSATDPDRITVDLKVSALSFDKPEALAGTGLVSAYDVDMVEPGRARATLTLANPAQVQQSYTLRAFADQPARLVIDLVPDTAAAFAKRAAADAAATAGTPSAVERPKTAGQGTAAASAASPTAAPPIAHARPLIVLDPGHGGIDSGARVNGTMEKDVVLAFAKELQTLLIKTGRFDVALTRTDDTYLTLEQRVALARQNKADLFISIHADSFSEPQVRGTSLYTRDEQATDELDKVLADNENRAGLVSSLATPKLTPQVANALLDLLRRQMRKQSYLAAKAIVAALQPSVEVRPFPIRQADFFVLQAPDVPSMLIELGFMSNSKDMRNLTDPTWEDKVAAAMTQGISSYFDQQDEVRQAEAEENRSRPARQAATASSPERVADAPAP
jgi:N-acetylmuramoyl-L-alanine amidase